WVLFEFSVTANAVGEGVIGMVSGCFVSSGFEVGAVEFLSFVVECSSAVIADPVRSLPHQLGENVIKLISL
ncbi:hypothetical protein MJI31_23460, partial [Salmonella enterica subsp. enterica serovar Kentucky]|nr:hypothetical protein [Salmonella enterica subsp. enterica serovar Kentucky]